MEAFIDLFLLFGLNSSVIWAGKVYDEAIPVLLIHKLVIMFQFNFSCLFVHKNPTVSQCGMLTPLVTTFKCMSFTQDPMKSLCSRVMSLHVFFLCKLGTLT